MAMRQHHPACCDGHRKNLSLLASFKLARYILLLFNIYTTKKHAVGREIFVAKKFSYKKKLYITFNAENDTSEIFSSMNNYSKSKPSVNFGTVPEISTCTISHQVVIATKIKRGEKFNSQNFFPAKFSQSTVVIWPQISWPPSDVKLSVKLALHTTFQLPTPIHLAMHLSLTHTHTHTQMHRHYHHDWNN